MPFKRSTVDSLQYFYSGFIIKIEKLKYLLAFAV